ncbi:site-specific DNA-methyltransferase [Pasteurella atlantica]|uniref:site-specific DNA-methyltransferase (adenine-specific) n=1 Tax=Pasteurella atlantica TaxID=2827233 RepID=A0AAW8CLI3_9PAST|nr:site-specific DNA-methyltransferase [Pasteurella atlantica]MDP8060844.1 site-specific DNA-methyltransferase [Pasteurella atlantica]MDP8088542.1 site-specific DNA-methyltransferase [Pasteurella atlantica]MDP8121679.1 site-specific DNA-methyltransferase [Pasteurella atlantica]MDP8133525.1 site-specific DNA-methyltransferase [Pasteurella atlantica]MDP8141471.1 site-specific DNA-methyltransferase [Pasteurella atlantica]
MIDYAEKYDQKLLSSLLNNPKLKQQFFINVDETLVFKLNNFRFFLEENKINNSYTQFKNRIGLTSGQKFFKNCNDVVLDFPYKDCVLAGGQSSEEGTDVIFEYDEKVTKTDEKKGYKANTFNQKSQKRQEIFFNNVLAADEIDRLFDNKALISWKKFSADSEEKSTAFHRNEQGIITDNLIIKGNNLLALHSLKSEFAGQVKLIYIDPPYYFKEKKPTDTFAYNSNFHLSTWLTFMKNRLEVATEFLKDDGVIFISIDEDGMAYLKVLMDEIFGRENFVNTLTAVMNLKGNQDQFAFAGTHEYILCFAKNKEKAKFYNLPIDDVEELDKWQKDEIGFYKQGANLKATGTNAPRYKRPNLFYPIYVNENLEVSLEKKDGFAEILPVTDGQEMSWRWSKSAVIKNINDIIVLKNNETFSLYKKQRPDVGELPSKKPKTLFYKPEYSSGNGTNQIKNLFNDKVFSFPKPEEIIKDIIQISTQENDIVLDFHLGSGTTAAVAHKMKRQYIGVEQMDYIETIAVERLKKVIAGEQGGISKAVNWQGGGEFIYCELAQFNQAVKNQIKNVNSYEELTAYFDEIYNNYFLHYNIATKNFIEKQIQSEQFKALYLDEQKAIFCAMLDNNQLYVNQSEIDDEQFAIDEQDKVLSKAFYGECE